MRQLGSAMTSFLMVLTLLVTNWSSARGDDLDHLSGANSLFAKQNLAAWCIVPFDSQKRNPEQRAAMLKQMGITKLAYDYRAEHIPEFDRELAALRAKQIELTAWWFPTTLNDEAKLILDVLKRNQTKTQLWVTGGGEPTKNAAEQAERVKAEADRIRPIAEAAAAIGCQVALYNHGGWFGDPDNQLAIIRELKLPNVGIVYNLHHGHADLERLPELLQRMRPHLLAFNLNGMAPKGDQHGKKILPIGLGAADVAVLKTLRASGYRGVIGILNHTELDAEARLLDNLDGLAWLLPQLDGHAAGPAPMYRTWADGTIAAMAAVTAATAPAGRLEPGKPEYRVPPLTIECQATLRSAGQYNILVASDPKSSARHWELFTMVGNGHLTAYLPGMKPDHVHSTAAICNNQPHQIAMHYEPNRVRLYVDGQQVADQAVVSANSTSVVDGGLGLGRLVEGDLNLQGRLDWVRISRGIREKLLAPGETVKQDEQTLGLWQLTSSTASHGTHSPGRDSLPTGLPGAPPYDANLARTLAETASKQGDARRGALVFAAAKQACLSCHRLGLQGGAVGPELSKIATQRTPEQLVESVLWPKREVKPEFSAWLIQTTKGQTIQGFRVREDAQQLVLREISANQGTTGNEVVIPLAEIEERVETGSIMPEGLTAALSPEQQVDLFRFLSTLGKPEGIPLAELEPILLHAQHRAAALFDLNRDPVHPADWPHWESPVNRARLYDYYAKQANHFRSQSPRPALLGDFPGLDGGKLGHWGNQNEQTWESVSWNSTDLGTLQAGIFRAGELVVPRGVNLRLGEQQELSACFNPDTLTYAAVWKGGFVKFSKVRHGFMDGTLMDGELVPTSTGGPPNQPFVYHGFYRSGPRTVFSYRIGNEEWLDTAWVKNGQFERIAGPAATHPFKSVLQGGPRRDPWEVTVTGQLGSGKPYAVDTIPLPIDNPRKALIFCGGHDFLPDGTAYVCTMQGDVWRATGLDDTLARVRWTRFASGLNQCLGLVVGPDGTVYVQGRDQLTRLHDLNGDGEADFYECFSNAFQTSSGGHDFICGLERDPQGNFYTASSNQGVVRISADGKQATVLASGFRNPDGIGRTPDGLLTVPCSEGEWTPASMICAITPAMAARSTPPHFGYRGPKNGLPPELPLVYLPRGIDNSAGGQVYVDSDRWGPVQGTMVHTSFGAGTHFLLLKDNVGGQLQGAVVPLKGEFLSGVHRGRFNPHDGQLYVCGMAGWGTYTVDTGCFQRVRYTGAAVQLPIGFHAHENGIVVRFSEPLNKALAEDVQQQFAQCWNYRYSGAYGSAEFSREQRGMRGHDSLTVASATVLPDGRSLFLELPDLQPVNQLHLSLRPSGTDPVDLFLTVHRLDAPFTEFPKYRAQAKTVARHPIFDDLQLIASRVPNPWKAKRPDARGVRIEAGKNLSFSTKSLRVKAGETLALSFHNPDGVPHNWVLLKPGTLSRVGDLANQLIADPEAYPRHYIPKTDDVLVYTDIVDPEETFTIYFTAPAQPGRYPYLCSFPGHWMVMNGEMIVE